MSMINAGSYAREVISDTGLGFLWLELTNACNFECKHCYAESSPYGGEEDRLTRVDYEHVLARAYARGCRAVQFIGGEATLSKDLPHLIRCAHGLGYELIEVFSNLFSLSDELLNAFRECGVHLATSFYSHNPATHDAITQRTGSWTRTFANIRRVAAAGIPCRAGVILMEENAADSEATVALLRQLGIENVGLDHARPFGRGRTIEGASSKSNLCGTCSGNVICVASDGRISPCIMSKDWSIGNLLEASFDELLDSPQLRSLRGSIADAVSERQRSSRPSDTQLCWPGCTPCIPMSSCPPTCGPTNQHERHHAQFSEPHGP